MRGSGDLVDNYGVEVSRNDGFKLRLDIYLWTVRKVGEKAVLRSC